MVKKRKIVVYAISKNEEKFVERWYNSMKEADAIYVLDTGSTDKTVEKLKKLGVHVTKEIITPWRFDTARNKSLMYIPNNFDIYVCTDLDEVFEKGWRKSLEEYWKDDTTRARYNYNWQLDESNKPVINFYLDKIHIRTGYSWIHPVHEVLNTDLNENYITIDEIVLNHYPDTTKSRKSYLKLLELSVKEEPNDDRNMHYLGREYMYYGKWNKCIETLTNHLNMKNAVWKDERCASMRFIARSYNQLKQIEKSREWFLNSIKEAPYLREGWIELGILEYENKNYNDSIYYIEQGLKIKVHTKTYINEKFCWNETPYDILSICYYNIGNYSKALENIEKALEINPKEERILKNKEIIKNE